MTEERRRETEARLDEVRVQIEAIGSMLVGTLMAKRNRVRHVDGSLHVSPDYFTFQYRGVDGARKWKRIPQASRAAVERLVRAGERYRSLEREYAALLTQLSLADSKKKPCD